MYNHMIKIYTILFIKLTFAALTSKAQLIISSGASLNIQSSAVLSIGGNISGNGDVTGEGVIVLNGTAGVQNVNMNGFTIPNLQIAPASTFNTISNLIVEGDLTGFADITGSGKIILKGDTASQNVNMNGFTISNLEIYNPFNAYLTGNTRVGSSILFTAGKINTGNFNLNLAPATGFTGMGSGKFLETSGTGQVVQELNANVTAAEIPLGAGNIYRPAFVTTTGTYSNANIGVKVLAVADPNRPPSVSDYLSAYWPVTRTGVTGTVTLAGQYDVADVTGNEANLKGYYYLPADWTSVATTIDAVNKRISAPITASTGSLYAMDKFNLVKMKAFLQGAYNTSTGMMTDNLRTLGYLPNSDPYRVAPYTSSFTHVNNSITENVPASVFNTNAIGGDNIVDWVFLELRDNNTTANTILQTRSALIQRDGDIVDVDGVSPVTFNNMATGNYTVAVRHRNHLGLSTDPVAFNNLLSETKSTTTSIDISAASDNQLFGTAAAYKISSDGKNLLWGGNGNNDTKSNYINPANDKDNLLSFGLGGVYGATINGYSKYDFNMNGVVKYINPGNDKDFLLSAILGGSSGTFRIQQLP